MAADNPRQPTYRYIPLAVTTPAGTPQATPQVTNVGLGDVILVSVEVIFPPGSVGLMGVAIVMQGVGIWPWSSTPTYAIGSGLSPQNYDVDMEVGPNLQVWTYNTGTLSHTVYLRFKIKEPAAAEAPPSSPAPAPTAGVADVTVLQPPPIPTEVPPVSNPLGNYPGVDPNDPVIASLAQRVSALEQAVSVLQSANAQLTNQLGNLLAQVQQLAAQPSSSTPPASVSPPPSGTGPSVPTGSIAPSPKGPQFSGTGPVTLAAFQAALTAQTAQNKASGTTTPYPTSAFVDAHGNVWPSQAAWEAGGRP